MKEGILEVVVASAKGIKHTNVIGRPAYYVIIECGTQVQRTKTTKGNRKKIRWNEKLTFGFPSSELKHLTHLKLNIMDEEYFTNGGFVGKTIVNIQGIIIEGNDKGFLELTPTPYNVVLEDDTYKGEIKIGLKFISNKEALEDRKILIKEERGDYRQSLCQTIMSIWRIPCWKFLYLCKTRTGEDKKKKV